MHFFEIYTLSIYRYPPIDFKEAKVGFPRKGRIIVVNKNMQLTFFFAYLMQKKNIIQCVMRFKNIVKSKVELTRNFY